MAAQVEAPADAARGRAQGGALDAAPAAPVDVVKALYAAASYSACGALRVRAVAAPAAESPAPSMAYAKLRPHIS